MDSATVLEDVADKEQVEAQNDADEQESPDAPETAPTTTANDANEQESPDAPETAPATEGSPPKKSVEDAHLPFARVQRIIKADKVRPTRLAVLCCSYAQNNLENRHSRERRDTAYRVRHGGVHQTDYPDSSSKGHRLNDHVSRFKCVAL